MAHTDEQHHTRPPFPKGSLGMGSMDAAMC